MTASDPTAYAWWLASRASGITAFLLISCSVLLGRDGDEDPARARQAAPQPTASGHVVRPQAQQPPLSAVIAGAARPTENPRHAEVTS